MDCPFCKMEKLTKWHYDDGEYVVCEDLRPKQYKFRLLAVKVGPAGHKPKYSVDEHDALLDKLMDVVAKLTDSGEVKNFVLDYEMSIPDHFHIQACILE